MDFQSDKENGYNKINIGSLKKKCDSLEIVVVTIDWAFDQYLTFME